MSKSTQLSIQVADHPLAGLQRFTPEDLEAIAASLNVSFPENVRLVKFGPNPPSDRNTPWQQTLDDEITPIGGVKYFTNGQWAYPPGSQFSGPIGPQGDQGPQGPTGPPGPQGPPVEVEDLELKVNEVIFANTEGVALPAPDNADSASVAWNDGLQTLVRHDGTTVGGNPILLSDPSLRRGSFTVTNYTAAKETEIASFPLTALQAVVGTRFRVTGTIVVTAIGANKPPNFYIGFTTRSNIDDDLGGFGGFPARLGYLVGFGYPTASKDTWILTLNEELVLGDTSPNFVLNFYDAYRKGQIFNGATITGDSKIASDTVGLSTDVGLVGTPDEEIVLVIQGEAGGGSVGNLRAFYDLKFEQTA